MKGFLVTVAMVILGLVIAGFVNGDDSKSMKSQTTKMVNKYDQDMNSFIGTTSGSGTGTGN